jgi:hypothetical protein
MMPGYIASLIPVNKDHPNIAGWVANMDDMKVAIICYRVNGEWIPQYGIKRSDSEEPSTRLELPPCFELDPLAAMALEDFYISINAEMN